MPIGQYLSIRYSDWLAAHGDSSTFAWEIKENENFHREMEKLINEISSQWDSWIGDYGVERLSDRQTEIQSRVDRGEHFTVK